MRPHLWQPPVVLSREEGAIVGRIQRAKLFIFLRQQRHVLFSPAFQGELATTLYADKPRGARRYPPPSSLWRSWCRRIRASPTMK